MKIPRLLRTSFMRTSTLVATFTTALLLASGCSPGTIDSASAAASREASEASFRLESATLVDGVKGSNTPPNLRLLAPGSAKAKVVDHDLNVLLTAPPEGTIFSMHMSPNQELILISHGSAKYQVVSADGLDPVAFLPAKPPGQNDATGFSWRFLGDDYFLGSASLPSLDTAGKTMAEIEGLPPRAVLLYVYDWKTGQLSPVDVDETLPATFFIYDVSGWNVTLLTYDDDLVGARVIRSSPAGDTEAP